MMCTSCFLQQKICSGKNTRQLQSEESGKKRRRELYLQLEKVHKHEGQCMYNVALRSIHVSIVAGKKQ